MIKGEGPLSLSAVIDPGGPRQLKDNCQLCHNLLQNPLEAVKILCFKKKKKKN